MQRHRVAILLIGGGLAAVTGLAPGRFAGADEPAPSRTLRVVSYNVQFLPGLASVVNKRKDPAYRAKAIGQAMAEFDIVGLNEIFELRPRQMIFDALADKWGQPLATVVSPQPADKRVNGGLAIATRLPILDSHTLTYSQGSSPKDYGLQADGFAAKGALHARMALVEAPDDDAPSVDVFVTHLESKSDEIRSTQYVELSAFVSKYADASRPVLILGDMNTRGNPRYQQDPKSAYHEMVKAYREACPSGELVDVWPHLQGDALGGTNEQESADEGNRIDYVFYSNPSRGELRLRPKSVRVNGHLDPRVTALSDHSAVEAEFVW